MSKTNDWNFGYVTLDGDIKRIRATRNWEATPADMYWGAYRDAYSDPADIEGDLKNMAAQAKQENAHYDRN